MISTTCDCHYLKQGPPVSGQPSIQQRMNLSQASEEKPTCHCGHLGHGGGEAGKQAELDTAGGTQAHREHGQCEGRAIGLLELVWVQGF